RPNLSDHKNAKQKSNKKKNSAEYLEDIEDELAFTGDPYVVVKIGKVELKTEYKSDSIHPQWNEIMDFENYKPQGKLKTAKIIVMDKNLPPIPDREMSTATFDLPTQFSMDWQNIVLDVKSAEGESHGVVNIQTRALTKEMYHRDGYQKTITEILQAKKDLIKRAIAGDDDDENEGLETDENKSACCNIL
ncbi:hypothetical protein RFI_09203, partial [Reticulomyxa filosa]